MVSEGLPNLGPVSLWERTLSRLRRAPSLESDHLRKKPSNLLYDVDEVPPLAVRIGVSLQHIFLMSLGWLYVVVIVNAVGGTTAEAQSLIRISMVASGLATIIQARRRIVGSGYLCPVSGSLTYLQPSILAVRTGGFSLLFGMITLSGAFTAFLSRLASRLRVLFPPEVTGLMVSMSGLQLVALGCPRFAGYVSGGDPPQLKAVLVGVATLGAMVAATVWHRGKLQVLPMLIGLFVGFSLSIALGVFPWAQFVQSFQDPWISVPRRVPAGFTMSFWMILPFIIASLTASLKTVGDITLCQRINDADWKRTDMKSVSGGMMANGIGTAISGLFGGIAQNTVSSSVGLSLATGTTSRAIAVPTGLLVIALAFFPRVAAIFAAMPMPVMGALLIYSACFIILGGLQLLTSRMLDSRRIFVAGISMIFGLSVEISPDVYRYVPEVLRPIFSSSTAISTVLVVFLSLFFRMGVSKVQTLFFHPGQDSFDVLHNFMEEQGAAWGMRREVEIRAVHAIHETISSVVSLNPFLRQMEIIVEFDEFSLDAAVEYSGLTPILSDSAPTAEELSTDAGIAALSGYMIRGFADRVRIKQRDHVTRILLHFDH
jgi:NCS2 family nucleobase:cation symporter-2